jgi:ankyrin repeat protein
LIDKPSRFLLASLHVDSLVSKKTTTKLKSALENLSHGSEALGDAYNKAIDRIDGQEHDDCTLAKQVLSWISYARRPLTTQELCHALAVEIGDEDFDSENIPDVEDILSVCAGLVTIDEESQIIRLVHYTTQKYLEGILESWHPRAQYEIASTCLTYLCFEPFRSGPCSNRKDFERRRKEYSFLGYSAWYWPKHVAAIQEEICERAMTLLQDSDLVASAHLHRNSWYNPNISRQMTGLHLTASRGLLHLSEELLSWAKKEKMGLCDMKNDEGETPLLLAVAGGHRDIVELLLATGEVDVNVEDDEGETPLLLAVAGGHRDIVELLLATGEVDVNVEDEDGQTALMGAVEGGYKEIVKLLLVTGNVDIEAKVDGWTPVFVAVREGHKDIVELLLRAGADVNAKTDSGSTVLMEAARTGDEETGELLLNAGVDVNAKTDSGYTALMVAVDRLNKKTVELLLRAGADVNARTNGESTPLMKATRYGPKETVELLVSAGSDIHTRSKD